MRLSESVVYAITATGSIVLCCVLFLTGSAAVKTKPASRAVAAEATTTTTTAADDPSDEADEPAESTEKPKPETLGEALEVGDASYDPAEAGFNLFDPCKEITTQQWEQLGWKPAEDPLIRTYHDRKSCAFVPAGNHPDWRSGFVEADIVTDEQLDKQELLITDVKVTAPEGFYLYKLDKDENEFFCSAAVNTNRGRLSFTFGANPETKTEKKRTCQTATDILRDALDIKLS